MILLSTYKSSTHERKNFQFKFRAVVFDLSLAAGSAGGLRLAVVCRTGGGGAGVHHATGHDERRDARHGGEFQGRGRRRAAALASMAEEWREYSRHGDQFRHESDDECVFHSGGDAHRRGQLQRGGDGRKWRDGQCGGAVAHPYAAQFERDGFICQPFADCRSERFRAHDQLGGHEGSRRAGSRGDSRRGIGLVAMDGTEQRHRGVRHARECLRHAAGGLHGRNAGDADAGGER